MKKLCILLILSLSLAVSGCSLDDAAQIIGTENSKIESAKNSYLPGYSTYITLGQALDTYFTNPKWDAFTAQGGENVIECSGRCVYDGKTVDATFQFIVNGSEIIPYSLELDGEMQPGMMVSTVLLEAYNAGMQKMIDN